MSLRGAAGTNGECAIRADQVPVGIFIDGQEPLLRRQLEDVVTVTYRHTGETQALTLH